MFEYIAINVGLFTAGNLICENVEVMIMKKKIALILALSLMLTLLTSVIDSATSPGTYQCARCGVIVRINTSSSQLPSRDMFDGHTHDWRYIGGTSGTIHPIR